MEVLGWIALLGLGGAFVFIGYRVKLILQNPEKRKQLLDLLLNRQAPPPEPEVTIVPPRPDGRDGNVKVVESEWKTEPDLLNAYVFPESSAPVTRYEDLNRRLIIYTPANHMLPYGQLPARDNDDFPTRISCSYASLQRVISEELRVAYPVIIDPQGHFYSASALLELDPNYSDVLLEKYLAIPLAQRPVIISYTQRDPNRVPMLEFVRYRFEPARVATKALFPYGGDNLDFLFKMFLGDKIEWMWFSVARMRTYSYGINKPKEAKQKIIKETIAKNRFLALWDSKGQTEDDQAIANEPPTVSEETAA